MKLLFSLLPCQNMQIHWWIKWIQMDIVRWGSLGSIAHTFKVSLQKICQRLAEIWKMRWSLTTHHQHTCFNLNAQSLSSVGTMIQKTDNYSISFPYLSNFQRSMIAEKQSQDLWKIIQLISTLQSKFVNHWLISKKGMNENREKELKELRDNIR